MNYSYYRLWKGHGNNYEDMIVRARNTDEAFAIGRQTGIYFVACQRLNDCPIDDE